MIPRLVADIQKAIDNSCYFSALALALTLPAEKQHIPMKAVVASAILIGMKKLSALRKSHQMKTMRCHI